VSSGNRQMGRIDLASRRREVLCFLEMIVSETLVRAVKVHYTYDPDTDRPIEALRGIDLTIEPGQYLAIVGHNGSGKSTLAKCLNGLLVPTEGDVWVNGSNTRDRQAQIAIRATVGMVFQNPDSQMVSTVVEEEVAFGPENLGVPRDELRRRVGWALEQAGLTPVRDRSPRTLPAGQKALLAVASILAMEPACLVLDESTAMLDPRSRSDVLALVQRLHRNGMAVVAITHQMEEIIGADHVLVLERGRVALEGTPGHVFAQYALLDQLGLRLPPAASIARGLRERGVRLPEGILSPGELVSAVNVLAEVSP